MQVRIGVVQDADNKAVVNALKLYDTVYRYGRSPELWGIALIGQFCTVMLLLCLNFLYTHFSESYRCDWFAIAQAESLLAGF